MKVASRDEIQNIDRITINEIGIPGFTLMECAGLLVVKALFRYFGSCGKNILIFCGAGNNGGDGFVAARHLISKSHKCNIILLGKREKLKGDALANYNILEKLNIPVLEMADEKCMGGDFSELLSTCDIIIDAIFGTGLNSPLKGLISEIIPLINSSGKPVISVDIPTGINASSGKIMGDAIKASLTVTMGLPKLGLLIYPGASYSGKIVIADIGFPEHLLKSDEIKTELSELDEISSFIPERPENSHKGDAGKVLIIAGSLGYTGAAALTSESCLKTGAGLVTLINPESINAIMEEKLTETIKCPYPDLKNEEDIRLAKDIIFERLKHADALAIGPGIGRSPLTGKLVTEILNNTELPMVIDADALFPEIITRHKTKLPVVTPHPGEAARLLSKTIQDITSNPMESSRNLSEKYRCVAILKGSHSMISHPDGNTIINPTGNSGMSSAGMGDILTGIIACFLSQGVSPEKSAVLGAFIHGLAGDIVARKIGKRGIIASDLIKAIPIALKMMIEKRFDRIGSYISMEKISLYD